MHTFTLFFRYVKKYWFKFFITFFLLLFLNFIRSIIPKLTSSFVAIVQNKPIEESEVPSYLRFFYGNSNSIQSKLMITSIIIVCVAFVRELVNVFCDVNVFKVSELIGCDAQIDYLKKVQDLPYSFLNHAETGDLIQRSTQDINRFKNFITGSFLDLFNSLCKVFIYGACMFLIDVKFTLYVFIILPVYFVSSYIYFKSQRDDFSKMEEKESNMTTVLQENLTGIRIVKAFANEKYEINKFDNALDEYTSVWKKTTKRMSLFWGVSDFLTYSQLLLVFILAIIFAKNGMELDTVILLFLYTEQIAWPCRSLGRELAEFGKTSICCKRVLDILDMKDEYSNEHLSTPEIKGNIKFENVSFKFDDANIPILNNINLEIKKGETVAIIGKTGSGKSTFVNLLNRLVDPTEGKIYLDGNDITTIDKKWVRKNVGLILQEPFLFSGSILQNINIALPYNDENKAKQLARLAYVDKDIESFEMQYNTMVGERGVTLSGGQKQRIAIARMFATNKSIIVFDDSLSAVDTETDLKIRSALKENKEKITTFIITHRITTSKDADKIIIFEDGKISNIGTHDELIKIPGLYQKIWQIQNYFNENEGGEIADV